MLLLDCELYPLSMRRYLIILAIAIVVIGLAAAAYFLFFANTATVAVTSTGSTGSLPTAGQSAPTTTATSSTLAGGQPANSPSAVSSRLTEIAAGPVVPGEAVTDTLATASSSGDTTVHYIDRESGNVYAYSESAGQTTRTSNRTIPGIERAFWTQDGMTAFVQYLSGNDFSTVNTYGLSSNGAGGFFLPQNLSGLAVSSTSVLALASGVNGSSASLYHLDGSSAGASFTTPLSALRVAPAGKGRYLVFTKPSSLMSGYAYLVNAQGQFSRIAGPLNGLVALPSPDGKWALISSSSSGVLHLSLVDLATGASTALPVTTIADKCVWASDSATAYCGIPNSPSASYMYPDDWYQGAASFNDQLWKIDAAGRYAALVLDFTKATGHTLDAEALAVDQEKTTLVFVNKDDGSLWSYKL